MVIPGVEVAFATKYPASTPLSAPPRWSLIVPLTFLHQKFEINVAVEFVGFPRLVFCNSSLLSAKVQVRAVHTAIVQHTTWSKYRLVAKIGNVVLTTLQVTCRTYLYQHIAIIGPTKDDQQCDLVSRDTRVRPGEFRRITPKRVGSLTCKAL
jgi:hypothetical protein